MLWNTYITQQHQHHDYQLKPIKEKWGSTTRHLLVANKLVKSQTHCVQP